MIDEYSILQGVNTFGVITGKPLEIGDQQGRKKHGKRLQHNRSGAAKKIGLDLKNATFAVNGFGNVGSYSAICVQELGAKMIACNDVYGGAYNPDGMDAKEVLKWVTKTGSVKGFPGSKSVETTSNYLLCPWILLSLQQENIITAEIPSIKAKILAEAANGPTTPEADEILKKKDILVVPDVWYLRAA